MRMRRMANDGDLRDQRQRLAHEDMKQQQQQHMRSMQPGLHRRPGLVQQLGGGSSLDPNFYGGGPHDEYAHPLGMPPRSSQQQFMSAGGGGGPGAGLRPLSRDSHDMRYPLPVGYREHQPPHSRGYASPPPYGFLPPQMNNSSHGGYGPGPGDNGEVGGAPGVPVSGVLNGRANLRPLQQSRLSVAQPRARRALPPSPGRGNGGGGGGMSAGIMEGGGEGGRQGGNLSPFVGHQPHLRLPLPPVMSGGSFPPAFNNLDWDDGQVDAGGGGGGAGGAGGGGGGPGEIYIVFCGPRWARRAELA